MLDQNSLTESELLGVDAAGVNCGIFIVCDVSLSGINCNGVCEIWYQSIGK